MGQKIIIAGDYGSGKTEFAINLATQMSVREKVVLVDLDIVNPYFRSRDATEFLEEHGVEVVYNKELRSADLPALSPRIDTVLAGPHNVILDVGGDEGSRVLGRYKGHLLQRADLWLVVNCFRPFTSEAAGIMETARRIENRSGLKVSALVNNANLGRETSAGDIRVGAEITAEAAAQMGLPVLWHCARPHLLPLLQEFAGKLFSMDLSLFPADIT